MEARTFAAYLVDKIGEIRGKKAFQKLVYLAQIHGLPLNYSYRMHYYGPFSEELAEEFDGDIQKNQIVKPSAEASFIYQKGVNSENEYKENLPYLKKYQENFDLLLSRFGQKSPGELELYSTIHFVCETLEVLYNTKDKNLRIEEIKKAKYPKFSEPKIQSCYDDMVEWKLIS